MTGAINSFSDVRALFQLIFIPFAYLTGQSGLDACCRSPAERAESLEKAFDGVSGECSV